MRTGVVDHELDEHTKRTFFVAWAQALVFIQHIASGARTDEESGVILSTQYNEVLAFMQAEKLRLEQARALKRFTI